MEVDDIKISFGRQLVLTDRECVGVVIGEAAVSDQYVGFFHSLVVKVSSNEEVNRDHFVKTFSSLWRVQTRS